MDNKSCTPTVVYVDKKVECRLIPNTGDVYYISEYGDVYRVTAQETMFKLKPYDRKTSHCITISVNGIRKHARKIDVLLADVWGVEQAESYLKRYKLNKHNLYSCERLDIINMHKSGKSTRYIAKQYGITMQAVCKIINKPTT